MSDPGLYEQIALRRIHDGGITKSAGAYLDQGRPTPEYLTDVFDRLTWIGWAAVADGSPVWDLRRLSLTDAGQVRYAQLCERQARHLDATVDRQSSDVPTPVPFEDRP